MVTRDFRLFRSVVWCPWMVTYNLEFNDFPGDSHSCMSQLPYWVYKVLTRKADKTLEDAPDVIESPNVEYWLIRLAAEYTKDPLYYKHLWLSTTDSDTVANRKDLHFAPSIWYDQSRTEIRTGVDYEQADKKSFDEFCSMTEEQAVQWLNGSWVPEVNPTYVDEHKSIRRL